MSRSPSLVGGSGMTMPIVDQLLCCPSTYSFTAPHTKTIIIIRTWHDTLCAPKYTFWCWLWASSERRAGFCCAKHCRHPEKDMRAWAQKEVSREDGHQVGLSCPGVTQCIPPFAGVLLPHWEGPSPGTGSRPHTHHLFHLVPFGMVKPCSVSWLPLLSAAQIYQKNHTWQGWRGSNRRL